MRKIKTIVAGVALLLATAISAVAIQPAAMAAEVTCPAGTKLAGQTVKNLAECNVEETKGDDSLMGRLNIIINVALGVIGVLAVVVIIIGGFQYTTSQGDPGRTKKAKDTIMYGIIGLVVALLAFSIVNFVLGGVFRDSKATTDTKDDDTGYVQMIA